MSYARKMARRVAKSSQKPQPTWSFSYRDSTTLLMCVLVEVRFCRKPMNTPFKFWKRSTQTKKVKYIQTNQNSMFCPPLARSIKETTKKGLREQHLSSCKINVASKHLSCGGISEETAVNKQQPRY